MLSILYQVMLADFIELVQQGWFYMRQSAKVDA